MVKKTTKLMYAKLILIISISFLAFSDKPDKISYARFQSAFTRLEVPISLLNYNEIFIVHVGYCASTNYCGDNLIQYISHCANRHCLVIYDQQDPKFEEQLTTIDGIEMRFVERHFLKTHNVFSVYNIHIKCKRVKYLY